MPIPVQTTFSASTANGVTTSFPYAFKITDADDLEVSIDGVVQTTGFTVTGVGADLGGSVDFTVAPANGARVLRALSPILKRTTDYQQFGDWSSDEVDADFDRIWLALQALSQNTSRSLKLPKDTADDQVLTQDAAARAGKGLKFDSSGNITISDYDPDAAQADASAYSASASGYASAAAASASAIASGSQAITSIDCTGGAINGTTVGVTTPAAGKFTTLTAKVVGNYQVYAAPTSGNAGVAVTAPSTGYATSTYGSAGSTLYVGQNSSGGGDLCAGSPAYAGVISQYGAYPLVFGTNNLERMRIDADGHTTIGGASTAPGLKVGGVSTQVDYLYTIPANAGGAVRLQIDGATADVNLALSGKGTGNIVLYSNSNNDAQVVIGNTASANRQITLAGSNGGNPTIGVTGGTLAINAVVNAVGNVVCGNGYTLPAGGSTNVYLGFSSNVSNFGVYAGSGAPTINAPKGSLYLRSDGSATNNRMYVNTDGGTTWTAVITAA